MAIFIMVFTITVPAVAVLRSSLIPTGMVASMAVVPVRAVVTISITPFLPGGSVPPDLSLLSFLFQYLFIVICIY